MKLSQFQSLYSYTFPLVLKVMLLLLPVRSSAEVTGNPFVLPEPISDWAVWLLGLMIFAATGGGLGFLVWALIIETANKVFGDGEERPYGGVEEAILILLILAGAACGAYLFIIW